MPFASAISAGVALELSESDASNLLSGFERPSLGGFFLITSFSTVFERGGTRGFRRNPLRASPSSSLAMTRLNQAPALRGQEPESGRILERSTRIHRWQSRPLEEHEKARSLKHRSSCRWLVPFVTLGEPEEAIRVQRLG